MISCSCLACSCMSLGSSVSALGNIRLLEWLSNSQTESLSNSSLSPTRLSASATLLSAPQRYSMVKLNPARDATQQWPTASKLGVDIMYIRGLLSVFMRNGWYCRYSRNCSVIGHLRVRNSNLDQWYLSLIDWLIDWLLISFFVSMFNICHSNCDALTFSLNLQLQCSNLNKKRGSTLESVGLSTM